MFFGRKAKPMPDAAQALPGRADPIPTAQMHFVNGRPLQGPFPDGTQTAIFGLGCFWGAERVFWQLDGVWVTSVGYAGGYTPNPTYEEVCSGQTGHTEVVHVVFDPAVITYDRLVQVFLESHDPTQGDRQGNDIGTQYRSAIYTTSDEQAEIAAAMVKGYNRALLAAGRGAITTELRPTPAYYLAEDYHQQYLAKNPAGYCGIGGTGVTCPLPVAVPD